MTERDYSAQLKQQLEFLERSCALFDERKYENEAIRMAVVVRTIFHQTDNSTSLLSHLGNPLVKIPSYIAKDFPSDKAIFFQGLSTAKIQHMVKADLVPILDDGPPTLIELTFQDWWDQIVWVSGEFKLSRKQIVLYAANKDGGTHVDATLPESYSSFIDKDGYMEIPVGTFGNDKVMTYSFKNTHYSSLRQISWEVINSTSLTNLIVQK